MKKRQMKFILALCSAAVAVWIGGEILLGLVLDLSLIHISEPTRH